MNRKISILVVDDNSDFRELMVLYIKKTKDLEIIGTACDGVEAIEKIVELRPDVIMLDLIMPNLDGLGVLEKLKTIQFVEKPMIIVLSALGQDMLVRKAMSYGIAYYFVKPLEIGELTKRIRQMFDEKNKTINGLQGFVNENDMPQKFLLEKTDVRQGVSIEGNIEVDVTALLCEAGVPPHMIGYRYLREAIIYTLKNNKPFTSITRELYPAIGEMFATSPQKVERAIRNSIEKAWLRSKQDSMDSLLGYTMTNSKSKPTNSEFIAIMTEKVRMMQKN